MSNKPQPQVGPAIPPVPARRDYRPADELFSMQYFAELHAADDVMNAAIVWDRIADRVYAYLTRTHAETYEAQLPPIFSAFMPRSGGAFLFDRMTRALGYNGEYNWCISRRGASTECYPVDNAVRVYQKGGFFCQTNAQPSPWFRSVMDRHKTGPLWVHVRHPAEACLAGYFLFLGQGKATIRDLRMSDLRDDIAFLGKQSGFDLGQWPAFFAAWLEYYSGWLANWLDYADARPGAVYFTTFDELSDVRRLLTRMFAAHGFTLADGAFADEKVDDPRRDEAAPDWRSGLTDAQIAAQATKLAVWDRMIARRAKENPAAAAPTEMTASQARKER